MQLKPIVVPDLLVQGYKFVRWDEDSTVGVPVTLKVDPHGFFLSWTDQNSETDFLDLSFIRDTRSGKAAGARVPREGKLRDSVTMGPETIALEDKTLTVVYGAEFANINVINFCCNSKEIARVWADSILAMAYNLLSNNGSTFSSMRKCFTRIKLTADQKGNISVKNIAKCFVSHKDDRKRLDKALDSCGLPNGKNDLIPGNKFSFEVFLSFRKYLAPRTEVEHIFHQLMQGDYSGSQDKHHHLSLTSSFDRNNKDHHHKEHSSVSAVVSSIGSSILNKANSLQQNRHSSKTQLMTVDQVVEFLNREQRDPRRNEILYPYADRAKGREIVQTYEPSQENKDKNLLSVDGFLRYLMSDECSIVDVEKIDLHHDMDQPLNHYFINSSHNTYLSGHQLTGKSSVEMYRQALLSGCRCVELDCWNGRNSDEEPIITHGYTVVTEIVLKDVLEAIADSAFKTSDFPIVLSFENHCSPRQQAKIANYCRKIFGDTLLTDPLPSFPLKPGVSLPTPASLRRKVIIKNKKKHYHHVRRRKAQQQNQQQKGDSLTTTTTAGSTTPTTTTAPPINVKLTSTSTPEKYLEKTSSISPASSLSKPSLMTLGSDESGGSTSTAKEKHLERQDSIQLLLETQESTEGDSQGNLKPSTTIKVPTSLSTSCDLDDPIDSDSSGGELDDMEGVPSSSTVTTLTAQVKEGITSTSNIKDSSGGGSGAVTSDGDEQSILSLSLDQLNTTGSPTQVSLEASQHLKEEEAGAEMSALVLYIQPVRFHSFEYSESKLGVKQGNYFSRVWFEMIFTWFRSSL